MKRSNPNQLTFDFRKNVSVSVPPRSIPRAPIVVPAPDPIAFPCVRPCWAVIRPLSRFVGHSIRCKRPVGHDGYCETHPMPEDLPTNPTFHEIRQAYERNRAKKQAKKRQQERERQFFERTG